MDGDADHGPRFNRNVSNFREIAILPRYLNERSGAAENREEDSTNSSRSGVRLAEAEFSLEWENRSDTAFSRTI